MRLAWSPDFGYAGVDPEVLQVTEKAARLFEELGATVETPNLVLEDPFPAFWDVFATATYTSYGHLLEEHRNDFSYYGRRAIEHGAEVTGADLSRAIFRVDQLGRQLEDFFDDYDLLLSPTMGVTAYLVDGYPMVMDENESYANPGWNYRALTHPINTVGYPAASVPCGFSEKGLPIGLHIVGRKGAETTVLAASAVFEAARPWAERRPPVS